jgi:hypothetical protein
MASLASIGSAVAAEISTPASESAGLLSERAPVLSESAPALSESAATPFPARMPADADTAATGAGEGGLATASGFEPVGSSAIRVLSGPASDEDGSAASLGWPTRGRWALWAIGGFLAVAAVIVGVALWQSAAGPERPPAGLTGAADTRTAADGFARRPVTGEGLEAGLARTRPDASPRADGTATASSPAEGAYGWRPVAGKLGGGRGSQPRRDAGRPLYYPLDQDETARPPGR